jgi:hypothetical protein
VVDVFKLVDRGQVSGKLCSCPPLRCELAGAKRKNEVGLEKGLATLWSRNKITKRAYAGRGQEPKWEISNEFLIGAASDGIRLKLPMTIIAPRGLTTTTT